MDTAFFYGKRSIVFSHRGKSGRAGVGGVLRRVFRAGSACCLVAIVLSDAGTYAQAPAPVALKPAPVAQAAPTVAGEDVWEAIFLKGVKVGHSHTLVTSVQEAGRLLARIEHVDVLSLARFGQAHESKIKLVSFETPLGELVRFDCTAELGSNPLVSSGEVVDGQLVIETTTEGKKSTSKQAWPVGGGGFRAVARSLRDRPLEVGQTRRVQEMMPLVNRLVDIDLEAERYEATKLPAGEYRLLRIKATAQLDPQQKIETVLWTDYRGRVIKSRMDALDQESVRTTEVIAKAPSEAARFDVGFDSTVKLPAPLADGHKSTSARYRVRLDDGDPMEVFLQTESQQVRAIDATTAEVTVTAIRPDSPRRDQGAEPAEPKSDALAGPTDDDRRPNHFVQSDDPRIVAMAKEAVGERTEPWAVAVAIEKYVNSAITRQNYSQAFATAADVAESRQGDCTEYAVLLAALARASGIPTRVAVGLVYVESEQAFGYHMWDEAWIDGRWIPLDGTLARGGVGAGHLQLGYSSLAGDSAFLSVLPVAQVLGRVSIEVVDAR